MPVEDENQDLDKFLDLLARRAQFHIDERIDNRPAHPQFWVWLTVEVTYRPDQTEAEDEPADYSITLTHRGFLVGPNGEDESDKLQQAILGLVTRHHHFIQRSNLRIQSIVAGNINFGMSQLLIQINPPSENFVLLFFSIIGDYEPLATGSSHKALPPFLENKKAIVNIRNHDNRCFGYSILAAIYDERLPGEQNTRKNRASNYTPEMFQQQHLDTLQYPIKPADVPAVEQQIGMSINVFAYYDDAGRARYPAYISRYYSDWNEAERGSSFIII